MPPITGTSLPLRSTVRWRTQHADVSIWPATKRPLAVIVFICGNPGIVGYYDTFLSSLHASNTQYWEVIGLGHIGHSPDRPISVTDALKGRAPGTRSVVPSLQDQIDSKIDFLDSLRSQFGEDMRLVLVGHSVGAYISQQIMKKRPKLAHSMYGLFPTIAHIADTPNGRRLALLFRDDVRIVVTAFLYLLKLVLPLQLLRLLVRITTGQRSSAARTTARLLRSPATVTAAIAMAADEMKTIQELDIEFLKQHGHHITLYFAAGDGDGWVGSQEKVKEICRCLDESKAFHDTRARWHVCQQGMEHAFCLNHSSAMAEICASWVAVDVLRPVEVA